MGKSNTSSDLMNVFEKWLKEENFFGAFFIAKRLESPDKEKSLGKLLHATARKIDFLPDKSFEKNALIELTEKILYELTTMRNF